MKKSKVIKDNLSQIFAITEKNIKLRLRWKLSLIISLVSPLFGILMPLIILGQFFNYNAQFGPWNAQNYMIFVVMTYNISLLKTVIHEFTWQFNMEKYWETLPGLLIGPFNRMNLLFGIALANLVVISFPLTIIFIICYIVYPISIATLLFVISIHLIIVLIFSGIGLIVGSFAISNENISKFLNFSLKIIFWASCITYPFEVFPEFLQGIISLNPIYYLFDILRLAWIENNFLYTIFSHPIHVWILIGWALILPISGLFIFNKVYKKYGIVGY